MLSLTSTFVQKGGTADPETQALAESLARVHGPVLATRERSGTHLYMACPHCLELDGLRELKKRHLAVNVDKYRMSRMGLTQPPARSGRRRVRGGRRPADNFGMCMKSGLPFGVAQLLEMPTLEQRIPNLPPLARAVNFVDNTVWLEPDGRGNMVPEGPGQTVPITQLPADHPAVWYLKAQRGYDLETLYRQFQCEFCTHEMPEGVFGEKRRYWRKLPLGFKDTPQHRIIFYCWMNGVRKSWQARVPEMRFDPPDGQGGIEHRKYYLHPYTGEWTWCETLDPNGKWAPRAGIERPDLEWDITKYRNARGSSRREVLFGFDAAMEFNRGRISNRICGLTEGPLDAGRFGPPVLAATGKFLSDEQMDMICQNFDTVVLFPDNDKAGLQALETIRRDMAGRIRLIAHDPALLGGKDPGDLHPEEARALHQSYFHG